MATIRELGKHFNGRISPTNVHDGNVCTWTHPPNRPWESTITSGEALTQELRFNSRKHHLNVLANSSFLCVEVPGSFPIGPLSINKENANDPLLKSAGVLTIGERRYASFTRSGSISLNDQTLLSRTSFKRLVSELDLQPNESLHFTPGGIYAYLEHSSTRRARTTLENLILVAEEIEQPTGGPDLSSLPAEFHPMIPLIKKWAIDDDSDREDLLESSPNSALQSLVAEVSPFLRRIDSFLDSFGEHPSEAACALGRLAECALEAKRVLEQAKGDSLS